MRRVAHLLPLLLLAGLALGSDGGAVPVELGSRGGRLWGRLDLRAAFPEELRRTFANGLTNVVSLHVALLPDGGDEPAALFGRVVEARYDVWEETWAVQIRDPQSPRGRRLVVRGWEELRGLLADARDLDLGPVAALGQGSWQLRARVELNPVSRELLERTREYIANPPSGVRGATPSRSVLGAMASYLLHGSEASEARLFHSRSFTGREVSAR